MGWLELACWTSIRSGTRGKVKILDHTDEKVQCTLTQACPLHPTTHPQAGVQPGQRRSFLAAPRLPRPFELRPYR